MKAVLTNLAQKVAIPHTAVVVIDMQNDFWSEEGALAQSGRDMTVIRPLVPRLQQFLDKARKKDVAMVFVRTARSEEEVSPPMKELWIRHSVKSPICERGSWGAEFVPEIQPRANEIVIAKTMYSRNIADMGVETLLDGSEP